MFSIASDISLSLIISKLENIFIRRSKTFNIHFQNCLNCWSENSDLLTVNFYQCALKTFSCAFCPRNSLLVSTALYTLQTCPTLFSHLVPCTEASYVPFSILRSSSPWVHCKKFSCLLVLLHMNSPLLPSVFLTVQNPVSGIIETGQKHLVPNIRVTKLSALCRHIHWKFIFSLWCIDHQVQKKKKKAEVRHKEGTTEGKKRNFKIDSVQSLSRVQLFVTPWTAARQDPLSITNSQSLLKLMVMPSNHLILCRPLLLPPSIFPSIRVFENELALCIRWPKYWSFSLRISPSNEYSGLSSFRMDCLDLLAVQRTL